MTEREPVTRRKPSPTAARAAGTPARRGRATRVPGLDSTMDFGRDRLFTANLSRGLEVLRAFSVDAPVLGNREICDRTGIARSTVSRLTYTLVMLGYLSPVGRRYRLATGVLSLAYPMLAGLRIRELTRQFTLPLARRMGCNVNLAVRDRLRAVYIDSCRADPENTFMPEIGRVFPLLPTAIGRALILGSPRREVGAVMNRLRLEDPVRFEQDHALFERDAEHFARYGYCANRGEWGGGYRGVAAPIRQPAGWEPVAVNCTVAARTGADDPGLIRALGEYMREMIGEIEAALCVDRGDTADRRP